jgi:hypothetical protein
MQYFWHLYSTSDQGEGQPGEQYAIPYYGYNTGADGEKLFDVSFNDFNTIQHLRLLPNDTSWSDGDTFGISYNDGNVLFTLNGNTVHTHDASGDYVATEGATSQVAFSSHWQLQGTPVYDLAFSAL